MDYDVMEFLKKEERRLCEKYQVSSIQEVLNIQANILKKDE